MVETALALGIVVNLVFTEVLGLASGGLIVPGYLALYLNHPDRVAATLAVGIGTWAVVRFGIMRLAVLYGRRRFGITVLTGFAIHATYGWLIGHTPALPGDARVIGYLIPGLIANTALAQGLWPTLGMSLAGAVIVRLLLAAASGWL
ncbi:MAG: poly-gamma-glutamate biosynthesis protein PgsC [Acidobacteriota bacterium]